MDFSSSGGNNSEPLRLKKSKKKRGIYEKIGKFITTNKEHPPQDRIYENSRSLKSMDIESSSDEGQKTSGRIRTRSERGLSLDYGQMDKRGLSWFDRESRSTEHTLARPLKEQKRKHHTLDRTEKYVMEHLRNKLRNPALSLSNNAYSSSQEWNPRHQSDIYSPAAKERSRYLSSGRSADDLLSSVREGTNSKKAAGSLQVGKRFLRGEIGIKSFNYYLIKEGLKTTPLTTNTASKRANPEKDDLKSNATEKREEKRLVDQQQQQQQRRGYKDIPGPNQRWLAKKAVKSGSGGDEPEENIYEEIFFRDRMAGSRRSGEKSGVPLVFHDDCDICTQQEKCAKENCEICKSNCVKKRADAHPKRPKSSNPKARPALDFNTDDDEDEESETAYARIRRGRGGIFVNKYAEMGSHYSRIVPKQDAVAVVVAGLDGGGVNKATPHVPPQQPVLQFQSYNPNNPGVYKIETTPIAVTNHYNPFEAKSAVDSKHPLPNMQNIYQEIRHINVPRGKSSSSSDSLTHSRNMSRRAGESFRHDDVLEEIYVKPRQGAGSVRRTDPVIIFKTPSDASMLSEEAAGRPHKVAGAGEMSDSSIGDSLFSCPNQRHYFGSSESCRLGSDCQRCLERCNYYSEDNANYCRHCDCSSSYFSSDFDEYPNGAVPGAFNRNMSSRVSVQSNPATASSVSQQQQQQRHDYYYDYPQKTRDNERACEPGYGEEFMRHVIHVKNTTSKCDEDSYYSKPKPSLARAAQEGGRGGSSVVVDGVSGREEISTTTTKALATEDAAAPSVEIRNRDSKTARKDAKRNVRKKYYYDDIMTIPNEVVYNLSYGMIRRDNKARDVAERDVVVEHTKSSDGFRIYEEIKDRSPESTSESKQKEPTYAVVTAKPNTDVKEEQAESKVMTTATTSPGYDDEIPTVQMMKMSQPIYASPVKVKRILAADKKPMDEAASSELIYGHTEAGTKWTAQCGKSNLDTSLEDVSVIGIEMKKSVQTDGNSGQKQSVEWKAQKCPSRNNLVDEEIDPIRKDGIGDTTHINEVPSILDQKMYPVSLLNI